MIPDSCFCLHPSLPSSLYERKLTLVQQYDTLARLAPEQAEASKPKSCPFNPSDNDAIPKFEDVLRDPKIAGGSSDRSSMVATYNKAAEAYSMFRGRRPRGRPSRSCMDGSARGGAKSMRCPVDHTSLAANKRYEQNEIDMTHRSLGPPRDTQSQYVQDAKSVAKRPITPAESQASGPVCPIRMMDKASPEDIAAYFEEHKHELPRSHEICVNRYQSNADSIRKLDEQYGSLVTMIQGLGQKHKPMLPEANEEDEGDVPLADADTQKRNEKIEAWSKGVSGSSDGPEATKAGDITDEAAQPDERAHRFDRPLKEIRVGESPSRPWGVPIPSKYLDRETDAESASSVPKQAIGAYADATEERPTLKVEDEKTARPKGKCPFDHVAMVAPPGVPHPRPDTSGPTLQLPQEPAPAGPSGVAVQAPEATAPDTGESRANEAGAEGPHRPPKIVNHGTLIVAPSETWSKSQIENHGTMYLANNTRHAGELLRSTFNRG